MRKISAVLLLVFLLGFFAYAFAEEGPPVFTESDLQKYKYESDESYSQYNQQHRDMLNTQEGEYSTPRDQRLYEIDRKSERITDKDVGKTSSGLPCRSMRDCRTFEICDKEGMSKVGVCK